MRIPAVFPDRPEGFERNQDYLTFATDVFWDVEGNFVHVMGPPAPAGLPVGFRTYPGGEPCRGTVLPGNQFNSDHYRVTVPPGAQALEATFGGQRVIAGIQPNLSDLFVGRRVLLTVSRNNDLQWIVDWARFHVVHHGVDAVVLYDNRSTTYAVDDVARALAVVPGLEIFAAIDWPTKYGFLDEHRQPRLNVGLWGQRAALEHGWRRLLMRAEWILSVDVDELLVPDDAVTLEEVLARTSTGSVMFPRTNVVVVGEDAALRRRHLDFSWTDQSGRACKSVMRPARVPQHLRWGVHGLHVPAGSSLQYRSDALKVAHFLPLTSGWRHTWRLKGRSPDDPGVRHDDALRRALDAALRDGPIAPEPWTPLESNSAGLARLEAERLSDLGDLAGALALIEHVLRLEPDDPRHGQFRQRLVDQLAPC